MESSEDDDTFQHSYEKEKSLVSSTCKFCKKDFTPSTIFKHVSHSICKEAYSMEEFQAFKNSKQKRHNESLRRSYNPTARREKYLKEKKLR